MRYWLWMLCFLTADITAAEHKFSGVLDVRASYTDGIDSYVDGGLGKLRYDDGSQFSIAQAGLTYQLALDNGLAAHVTANGYLDGVRDSLGITEAFVKYRGLPSQNGFRVQAKLGLMYPSISLENVATAWSSPYTLSYSTINSWLGEEFRHIGAEVTLEHLGKFTNSQHDFALSAATFQHNDTAGAMLAWHGWTMSSRQTLIQETLPLSNMPSLSGGTLKDQAAGSDPFLELDSRFGYHVKGSWRYKGKGELSAGYYDNNADTLVFENGQYAWRTRFFHIDNKWHLPYKILLLAQYMRGDTLMQSPQGIDVVNNQYQSAYLLLSRRWQQHRLTLRFEKFDVTDNDLTPDDDNNEDGYAMTASYQYRLSKGWFLQAEYNRVDSSRAARVEQGLPYDLIEQQWQLASRWYF
ncbi:hypothetical protein [Shewanella waksmanii]|uniref:hypothetical protein n=1 Tax=Shewanella waksmanii TaxID=213783 RepID=UPI00068909EE|nr:hypothetical protein [Shewanella waksmanii]